jgi:hypothetical protein
MCRDDGERPAARDFDCEEPKQDQQEQQLLLLKESTVLYLYTFRLS